MGSVCLLAILLGAATPARAEKISDLKPQGCVNDFSNVLSFATQDSIRALCKELLEKTGASLVVATVNTTEEIPIQQFSVDLAQQWGVGKKGEDRGVLVLLAIDDRKYWTAVGYGLEPILPDGKVGGFGRDMRPFLRLTDYNGALLQISNQIASVIAQDRGVTLDSAGHLEPPPGAQAADKDSDWGIGEIITLITVLVILGRGAFFFMGLFGWLIHRGPRGRGSGWFTGGFGGSGSSSGSWGGGSFGGGGSGGFGGFGGGSFGGGGGGGSW